MAPATVTSNGVTSNGTPGLSTPPISFNSDGRLARTAEGPRDPAELLTSNSAIWCDGLSQMLSATSQYALRALACLSSLPPDSTVRGEELSRKTGIPRNYLSKVLLTLGNAGIIEASRGSGGGYRLSSPPETIPLVRIVELFERHVAKRTCLLGLRPVCSDEDPCTAHHAWKFAKTAYFDFLESTSLRDISAPNGRGQPPGRRKKRTRGAGSHR